jgi:large subunit ribosomal protein L25
MMGRDPEHPGDPRVFAFFVSSVAGTTMAETVTLTAQKREGRGSRKAEHLRKQGKIPAVVYGHKEATVSLSLSAEELISAIRHGARVIDLKADGKTEKALIREIQWDHLGKDILHVDLARVSADERIHVAVKIELRGIAPGVNAGGVLDQPMHTLTVECLAISVPESIRVNIADLQIGGSIYVRELHLPEGVTADADPDAVVVHVSAPQVAPEAAAAPAATETAEPEVIGRKAAEEEEEEKK